jgi:hypothetical protein
MKSALVALAALCGLIGACYWFRSSQLKWQAGLEGRRAETFVGPNQFELFFQKVAGMNATAAIWTAVSLVLNAFASFA